MKKTLRLFLFTISVVIFLAVIFSPIKLEGEQKITLAIFVLALLLWITEVVPLYITSLVVLLLEAILLRGYGIGTKELVASFFSPVLLLFLGGFALARGLQIYRTDEKIVRFITMRSGKSPYRLLFVVMFSTAFLSMWMSNTATTALMIAITYPIIDRLSDRDPFKKGILFGIPFAANIGGMGTPIGTPPNALAMEFIAESCGTRIGFLKWMLYAVPMVIVLLTVTWLILSLIYRPGIKVLPSFSKEETIRFRGMEFVVIGVAFITILLWLTSSLHKISSSIVALIPIIIFGGLDIMKRKDFLSLSWDVLILMGGGLSLGYAMKKTGLTQTIINSIGFSSMSSLGVIILLIVVVVILTNFMSNTSAAAVILPIGTSLCMSGIGLMAIALAASTAMLLPISTPPNAIAYGSGKLKVKDFILVGGIITLLSTLLIVLFTLIMA